MKNSTLVFLLFLSPFCGLAQNLDSGLVLQCPFNGNPLGSTSNQYNGTVNGATSTDAIFPNSGSFDIGKHAYFSSRGFFNGFIDDIRIYNEKLEEGEIRRLYKEMPCVRNTKGDTLQILVTDTIFRPIGNQILLANSQVFTSYLGCDSIIETYQCLVYKPVGQR